MTPKTKHHSQQTKCARNGSGLKSTADRTENELYSLGGGANPPLGVKSADTHSKEAELKEQIEKRKKSNKEVCGLKSLFCTELLQAELKGYQEAKAETIRRVLEMIEEGIKELKKEIPYAVVESAITQIRAGINELKELKQKIKEIK